MQDAGTLGKLGSLCLFVLLLQKIGRARLSCWNELQASVPVKIKYVKLLGYIRHEETLRTEQVELLVLVEWGDVDP